MTPSILRIFTATLSFVIFGCSNSTVSHEQAPPNRTIELVRLGMGQACSVNGKIGPPTYSVYDLGRAGVPTLSDKNRMMIRKILKYVHPTTLRFAFLGDEFIVFDSYPGLCNGGAPFYVLNQRCDESYAITDVADATVGGGDLGCVNAPRPWIPHDKGSGKQSWSSYDNSH